MLNFLQCKRLKLTSYPLMIKIEIKNFSTVIKMKKFYLDIGLLIIFLLVMSFHFIPKILHEVLGLVFFVMIAIHFKWNINAFKSLFKQQKKWLSIFLNAALFFCIVVIIFTGVCISNYIFNGMIDMQLQRNITIHQLHVSIPFLMIILIGLHLGLHWQGFFQRLKNILNINSDSIIYKITSRLLIVILIVAGIFGSFMNKVGGRLQMQHLFATPASQQSFEIFLLMMIGMIAIYTLIGFIISKVRR